MVCSCPGKSRAAILNLGVPVNMAVAREENWLTVEENLSWSVGQDSQSG